MAQQEETFDWIKIKQEIGSENIETETFANKLKRKFSENPIVPIGAALTTAALSFGLYTMRTGDKKMSQYMMRARIVAQGVTMVAICGGILANAVKMNEKK